MFMVRSLIRGVFWLLLWAAGTTFAINLFVFGLYALCSFIVWDVQPLADGVASFDWLHERFAFAAAVVIDLVGFALAGAVSR